MTKQEIINKIKTEFKGKAIGLLDRSVYLTEDGRKCAIGLFIPDGHVAQSSVFDIFSILKRYPELKEHMPSTDIKFLEGFQNVHDDLSTVLSVDEQTKVLIDWVEENY